MVEVVAARCAYKYHCWAFALDGTLNHIPDAHEFIALDKRTRNLKTVRCETLGNLVFVNRNPGAPPLRRFLGPIVDELRDFAPESWRFVTRYAAEARANWKINAFLEVYHLKHIHPQPVDTMIDHRGATMALFDNGHSRMMVPARTGAEAFVSVPALPPRARPAA